jgi:uncharacterized DUF497 family protein
VIKSLPEVIAFEWDKGNVGKNFKKHNVSNQEAEEIFFNEPVIVSEDEKHSRSESRHILWGRTNNSRRLAIIFTIRNSKIRIISARDMNRKERGEYEKT